jgi:hypothetical protein
VVDVTFFVPGTPTPALTNGFGAVFSDVDFPNGSSLQLFGASNQSLGSFLVPNFPGNETFSFLGVSFSAPLISRVRITSGDQLLGLGNILEDVVVMDDFIFGEPQARTTTVPDQGATLTLLSCALVALVAVGRFRPKLYNASAPH